MWQTVLMLQTTKGLVSSIFLFESHVELAVLMIQNTDSRSIIILEGTDGSSGSLSGVGY